MYYYCLSNAYICADYTGPLVRSAIRDRLRKSIQMAPSYTLLITTLDGFPWVACFLTWAQKSNPDNTHY